MSVDLDAVPISHPGQKQAPADLLGRLEVSEAADATDDDVERSKAEVARDMGW